MKNTDKARQVLAEMVDRFSSEEFPETAAEVFLQRTGVPSDGWSYCNRLIMHMHGTADARGFRQWSQGANRYVCKGAKALYILAPSTITPRDEDGRDETYEDADGSVKKRKIVVGFRAVPVFRYEDTKGEPVQYVQNPPPLPPLHEVAERWGICITYDGTQSGESGSYNLRSGEIRLCVADPSTFFHELAHAAHARLEQLKPGQDAEQEAVAQLTACILARLYHTDNVDAYTWNYLAHYARGRSPEAVGRLCHRVIAKTQKVLETVLGEAAVLKSTTRASAIAA